jgi:hypothetical protein
VLGQGGKFSPSAVGTAEFRNRLYRGSASPIALIHESGEDYVNPDSCFDLALKGPGFTRRGRRKNAKYG